MENTQIEGKLISLATFYADSISEAAFPDVMPLNQLVESNTMGESGSCRKGNGVSWNFKENTAYIAFLKENE